MMSYDHVTYTPSEDVTTESTDDLEEIEIISTQIIRLEAPKRPVRISASTVESREEVVRRKRINRIVGFFAALIFLTCIALVFSTLMMSKDIDELVRNSNEFLRNKVHKSTPAPKHSIDITDYNTTLS